MLRGSSDHKPRQIQGHRYVLCGFERSGNGRMQDFSDLVAAKAAQQKRKAAEKKEGKAKKQKEQFKF